MKCPICGTISIVKDSRMQPDNTRKRHHVCRQKHEFFTIERIEAVKAETIRTKGSTK